MMRSLLTLVAFISLGAQAAAFNWDKARNDLGTVEVKGTSVRPLSEGAFNKQPWHSVPPLLASLKTNVHSPNTDVTGFAEYNVTKDGWIFFGGHFGGEGSPGPWQNERSDEEKLRQDGWVEITPAEMGGYLIEGRGRIWKIFARRMKAGEAGKLRTTKYSAPHFFSFAETSAADFASLPRSYPKVGPPPVVKPAPVAKVTPAPSATPPRSPTAPGNSPTPASSAAAASLVKEHRANLVFVTMEGGAGSGFIASYGNGTYLITNAHVAAGAKGAVFKTLDNTIVQAGAPAVAVDHDIFLMALKQGGNPLPVMIGVDENASIGDDIVVLGNAEGAGVINTITGRIVGLGPNLVEVDAPFQPGNSGSPIIHLKTGKVIGVATYAIIRKYDPATKEAVKDPVIRRFGYRLDSIKKWEPVNWPAFNAQAAEMENIEKLTRDLVGFLQDLGKDGKVSHGAHSNPVIKTRIDQWIEAKSKRLSARDSSMADQSFLGFLKVTCQSDITAAQQRVTYDYFRRQLDDEQKERTEIARYLAKIIEDLRQER